MATLIRCLVQLNGNEGPDWFQAGAATIYPSYLVMEDDADEVTICGTDARPIGIAGCPSYHDLNTAYSSGEKLPVWMRGCGVVIYALFDDGSNDATLDRGNAVRSSGDTAGCMELWAYVDGTEHTDSFENVIGTLVDQVTITGDVPTFVQVLMSI